MSMFTVTGQVVNIFDQPGRTNKETGEIGESSIKIQILGDMPVQNGQSRLDMVTLTVESKKPYLEVKGKKIRLPLGFFAPSKGQIVYYVPKGASPEVVVSAA